MMHLQAPHKINVLTIMLLTLMVLSAFQAMANEQKRSVNVLFVSYGSLYENFDTALKDSLIDTLASDEFELVFYDEYLDSQRFQGPKLNTLTQALIQQKYKGLNVDIVIFDSLFVADMLNYKTLFPAATNKIIQLHDNEAAQALGPNTFTYSIAPDYLSMFANIAKVSGASHIQIVADAKNNGFLVDIDELAQIADVSTSSPSIELIQISELSQSVEKLRADTRESVVFVTPFYSSRDGNLLNPQETANQLALLSDRPVFVPFESMIGEHVVGGYVISPEQVGKALGDSVKALMNNKPFYIDERHFYQKVLNYKAIAMNNMVLPALDKDVMITNKPPTLIGVFLKELVAILIFLVLMTLLVLVNVSRNRVLQKQKKALVNSQNTLKKIHQRIDMATRSASIGIWEYHVEEKRLTWDKMMFAIHHLSPKGQSLSLPFWLEVLHKDDRRAFMRLFELPNQVASTFSFDYRCIDQNARTRYYRLRGQRALNSQGVVSHFIGTVIDVSHSRENEKRLRLEHEKAQLARQSKTAFLANMSHEIRTPMNGVIGAADILSMAKLKPDQARYTQMIKSSAMGLLHILDDILDLSKVEGGEFQIVNKPIELRSIVQQTMSSFALEVKRKGLKMKVHYPDYVPETMLLDGQRIKQVLFNLVGNAVKFTSNGFVQIEVDYHFAKHAQSPQGDLTIKVVDSGVGIDAKAQARIFDSFEQLDESTVRKYGGTGLGLSISKNLVSLMKGSISLQSEVDVGSTFSVCIPNVHIVPCLDIPKSHKKVTAPNFSNKRILVVEDIEINREIVASMLKDCQAKPDFAKDGIEAVQRAKSCQYDLIIMDILMPNMDGFEATRAIRAYEEERSLPSCPIVALTAHALKGDEQECLAAGMDAYLSKPIDRNALYSTLNRYLHPALENA